MTKSKSVRAGRIVDAEVHLLDRQVLDPEGMPITAVSGLEISDVPFDEDLDPRAEAPVIENLLSGPVLGTRLFGGRPPVSRWTRIPWSDLTEIGIVLAVRRPADSYDATWPERWAAEHVVGRIPGGRHDPE